VRRLSYQERSSVPDARVSLRGSPWTLRVLLLRVTELVTQAVVSSEQLRQERALRATNSTTGYGCRAGLYMSRKQLRDLALKSVVRGVSFDGADLSQLCLIGITFQDCSFKYSDLRDSDLSLSKFLRCDLYNAQLGNSVMYTTWFRDCNLTKAQFCEAYLLGFRLKDVDITKASFDREPRVGLERKPRDQAQTGYLLTQPFARLPAPAPALEAQYAGISTGAQRTTVAFLRVGDQRFHLRVAETAKYLKRVHFEDGYHDQAIAYHVVEQRHRRKAMSGGLGPTIHRSLDFLFGELLWRYGSSLLRPLLAIFGLACSMALLTLLLPHWLAGTGLIRDGHQAAYTWLGWNKSTLKNLLEVAYFYLVAPTGVASGELRGVARILFVVYMFSGVALLGLYVEASLGRTRKSFD
jgi:hypothetical protein